MFVYVLPDRLCTHSDANISIENKYTVDECGLVVELHHVYAIIGKEYGAFCLEK